MAARLASYEDRRGMGVSERYRYLPYRRAGIHDVVLACRSPAARAAACSTAAEDVQYHQRYLQAAAQELLAGSRQCRTAAAIPAAQRRSRQHFPFLLAGQLEDQAALQSDLRSWLELRKQ